MFSMTFERPTDATDTRRYEDDAEDVSKTSLMSHYSCTVNVPFPPLLTKALPTDGRKAGRPDGNTLLYRYEEVSKKEGTGGGGGRGRGGGGRKELVVVALVASPEYLLEI